ncbi:hypothetical protein [Pseudobutyrivibrio sp. OR37]|uniref:hypothetical protein n=1 Tax=Pseudobutyrivibrio sp. OR37 TaxID=1798186 RepID=UPI0011609C9A|nr:hypothetical protein [Pseudobutyrivibrio sp. OR37]
MTGKSVLLPSVETKKVIPSDYRLFQVADFICTMKLTELKLEKHNMSVQELRFFSGLFSLGFIAFLNADCVVLFH